MSTTFPANPGTLDRSAGRARVENDPPPVKRPRTGAGTDRLFGMAAKGAALLTLALLIGILLSLLVGAWPAISKFGLGFLTSSTWDPVKDEYGGLVMIYGTLATSIIALVIAVPVSFGIALFLTEMSPSWLKRPLGTAIELLAAVATQLQSSPQSASPERVARVARQVTTNNGLVMEAARRMLDMQDPPDTFDGWCRGFADRSDA